VAAIKNELNKEESTPVVDACYVAAGLDITTRV
jgi:hypothetical protein